ncbi:hypothetical protein EDB80DRAFT_773643 [Ilyonectria destructans]|nr:hypothetical protein EDB80DRAFT_773643 [Ilyonectria destructans]
MGSNREIPFTFSIELQPLAQHIIDSKMARTPVTPPDQFKTGRRMAFAMTEGTIERLQREYRFASDLSKPIVTTTIPVVEAWRTIGPPSKSNRNEQRFPNDLLFPNDSLFPKGSRIPNDPELSEDQEVEEETPESNNDNEIGVWLAEQVNVRIMMADLGLDEPKPVIPRPKAADLRLETPKPVTPHLKAVTPIRQPRSPRGGFGTWRGRGRGKAAPQRSRETPDVHKGSIEGTWSASKMTDNAWKQYA